MEGELAFPHLDLGLKIEKVYVRVLAFPHLGLNLKIGKVYTVEHLKLRCKGDLNKLQRLERKLQYPLLFEYLK